MYDDPTLPLGKTATATVGEPEMSVKWGPFRLLERVGFGGFGEVYRAWDTHLEREIALKLLLPGAVANDEEYATMLREARAMASVQHPNIVHVYGMERHEGRVGFWTDFVKGKTLSALLAAQGPLGYREAAVIGIEVSRALSAVHRAGLLHRDIKAENVMREAGGRILLMDFGLSVGKRGLPGGLAGTPNYMAPELFRAEAASDRTDIYAMGVLLYYLVIGEYPVKLSGLSAEEVDAAFKQRKPLMDLRSELPASFLRTVRTAMEVDPERRFGSAGELAESLADCLDREDGMKRAGIESQASAAVISTTEHGRESSGRWKLWAGIAAVLVIAGAVLLPLWMRHRAAELAGAKAAESYLAILPVANETSDPSKDGLADGFTTDLIRQVSEIPHAKVISRTSVFRYKGQNVDVKTVGQNLHASAVMTGTMQRSGNQLLINVELSNAENNAIVFSRQYSGDNADLREVKADIVHDLAGALHFETPGSDSASTSSAAAYQAYLEGEGAARTDTPDGLHEGIRDFEKAVQLDPKFSLAWGAMADSHVMLGLYFERPTVQMPLGRKDAEEALKIDPNRPGFHGTLGLINLVYDWNTAAAASELASADAQMDIFHVLSCSTHLMHETGKSRHAEDILRRMEANDPESVGIIAELGCVAYYRRDYAEAVAHYRDAQKLDPHAPIPYWGLGKSLTELGKYRESIAEMQQFRIKNGFEPPILTAEIGYAFARAGNVAEAKKRIESLETLARSGYVDPYFIAIVNLGLHEKNGTYDWLQKAFNERSPFLISILTDPKWEESTSDPRFLAFVSKMNLSRTQN